MIWLRIILAIIFYLFSLFSFQDANVIDCRNDQAAYSQSVVAANENACFVSEAEQAEEDSVFLVLCATNGGDVDFSETNVETVIAGPKNRYTLVYKSAEEALKAVDTLSADARVQYAECDSPIVADSTETTYSFNSSGAIPMQFDAMLDYVDQYGTGSAMVAVLDSGVYRHSALSGKLVSGGYDYVDKDDDSSSDEYGHGTHVAGIIADCTQSVPVTIYPIRILNASGNGKISNAVNAIEEACNAGADVINFSICASKISTALDTAVNGAIDKGVIFVSSSGNDGADVSEMSPCHIDRLGMVVVGSARLDGDQYVRASYSNYGDSVDVYAYGDSILSCSTDGGYVTMTGTSMAAPHISAACALIRCLHGGDSPQAVEERLVAAAQDTGSVPVPILGNLVPQEYGFYIQKLELNCGETIALPTMATPSSAMESITYTISNPEVISMDGDQICAIGAGSATVTVDCLGIEQLVFEVEVNAADRRTLTMPEGLLTIDSEAFDGDGSLWHIILPDGLLTIGGGAFADCAGLNRIEVPASVTEIGENAFSESTIIVAAEGTALDYAIENGLQYIETAAAAE